MSDQVNGTSPDFIHSISEVVIFTLMTSLLSLLTALFNGITLYLFATSPLLRSFGDFFILNLAVADFNVGILSMPPYIPYYVKGKWTAGMGFCLFWMVCDYANTTSSSYSMGIISLDRYLMVSRPLWYRKHQSHRLRSLMMLIPWAIALTFFPFSILLWRPLSGHQTIKNEQCYAPFLSSLTYLLISACVSAVIPVLFVAVLNVMIYVNIHKRTLLKARIKIETSATTESRVNTDGKVSVHVRIRSQEDLSDVSVTRQSKKDGQGDVETRAAKKLHPADACRRKNVAVTIIGGFNRFLHPFSRNKSLRRDLRLARSLFILVFVYALCWFPYQLVVMVLSVCEDCIDKRIYEFSFWLLWSNSTINPILYPLLHKRFRYALLHRFRRFKPLVKERQAVGTVTNNVNS